MVDEVDRRDQVPFNTCAGMHAVTVIDLDADRNTGSDGDGRGGERGRNEIYRKKKDGREEQTGFDKSAWLPEKWLRP